MKIVFCLMLFNPALFGVQFTWDIFSHFQPILYLDTIWVSCRCHIIGSYLKKIHSFNICLLVGNYSLFTFNVITDKRDLLLLFFYLSSIRLYFNFCTTIPVLLFLFEFSYFPVVKYLNYLLISLYIFFSNFLCGYHDDYIWHPEIMILLFWFI